MVMMPCGSPVEKFECFLGACGGIHILDYYTQGFALLVSCMTTSASSRAARRYIKNEWIAGSCRRNRAMNSSWLGDCKNAPILDETAITAAVILNLFASACLYNVARTANRPEILSIISALVIWVPRPLLRPINSMIYGLGAKWAA